MIGIYKITSPSGKIYIGQSIDIEKRFKTYLKNRCESQRLLFRSFIKYGVENHIFKILLECKKEELNNKERYFQDLFLAVGKNGLNCSLTNTESLRYEHSDDTKKIMSNKKKGIKLSIEHAIKVNINLEKSRGRKSKPESIIKGIQTKIKNNTLKMKEETKEKLRISNIGKKRTQETKDKLSIAMKKRPPFSQEWRDNIGAKSKGRIFSKESKIKISMNSAKTSSKIVFHSLTGIYFDSAKEASKALMYKHSTFKSNINGTNKINKTNCFYI